MPSFYIPFASFHNIHFYSESGFFISFLIRNITARIYFNYCIIRKSLHIFKGNFKYVSSTPTTLYFTYFNIKMYLLVGYSQGLTI